MPLVCLRKHTFSLYFFCLEVSKVWGQVKKKRSIRWPKIKTFFGVGGGRTGCLPNDKTISYIWLWTCWSNKFTHNRLGIRHLYCNSGRERPNSCIWHNYVFLKKKKKKRKSENGFKCPANTQFRDHHWAEGPLHRPSFVATRWSVVTRQGVWCPGRLQGLTDHQNTHKAVWHLVRLLHRESDTPSVKQIDARDLMAHQWYM